MRRRLATTAGLAASGLMLSTLSAHPAAAAEKDCSVLDGIHIVAKGGGDQTYTSRNSLKDVYLWVKDTAADGHHVAVRLVTRRADGSTHVWSWHHMYSGQDTEDSWYTTASDPGGIRRVWHEVATFEGDTEIFSCLSEGENNIV